jgi:anti-sigma B factor antagonist
MKNPFQCSLRQAGEVTILDLEGKLVHTGSEAFRNQMNQLLADKRLKFIVNLEKVTAIDSTGIGALAASFTSVARQGGALKLLNPTGHVKIALGWTKLDKLLDTHTDEQQALASFS